MRVAFLTALLVAEHQAVGTQNSVSIEISENGLVGKGHGEISSGASATLERTSVLLDEHGDISLLDGADKALVRRHRRIEGRIDDAGGSSEAIARTPDLGPPGLLQIENSALGGRTRRLDATTPLASGPEGKRAGMPSPVASFVELDETASEVQQQELEERLRGPPGPQGPRGNSGPRGPTGSRGGRGTKGIHGDKGPTGYTGHKGHQGPQGNVGARGAKGEKGIDGQKGDTGNKGAKGAKGSNGLIGQRGPIGPKGIKGLHGLKGPKGDGGQDGREGDMGVDGYDGHAGHKGSGGPPAAAIDCVWGEWQPWENCTKTCGGGDMRRERPIKVYPQDDGKNCDGDSFMIQTCATEECPAESVLYEDEYVNGSSAPRSGAGEIRRPGVLLLMYAVTFAALQVTTGSVQ